MPVDKDVARELVRFETVFWLYDGLNGKIIKWTKEHGGTSDDPSVQVLVVGVDGEVQARAPDSTTYTAASLARWLEEQAHQHERAHPRTRMPFVRADVREGKDGPCCDAYEEARSGGKRVLLYFGREATKEDVKAARQESAVAAKFEQKTLDSKTAAEAADGFVLLRFDLADPGHARLAAGLGVTAAPRLLLVVPDAEQPEDLGDRISASSLAYRLKKAIPKKE